MLLKDDYFALGQKTASEASLETISLFRLKLPNDKTYMAAKKRKTPPSSRI